MLRISSIWCHPRPRKLAHRFGFLRCACHSPRMSLMMRGSAALRARGSRWGVGEVLVAASVEVGLVQAGAGAGKAAARA